MILGLTVMEEWTGSLATRKGNSTKHDGGIKSILAQNQGLKFTEALGTVLLNHPSLRNRLTNALKTQQASVSWDSALSLTLTFFKYGRSLYRGIQGEKEEPFLL